MKWHTVILTAIVGSCLAAAAAQDAAGLGKGRSLQPKVYELVPMATELKPASAFDSMADGKQRSAALFKEAAKVFQHPRCLNCHSQGGQPSQTNRLIPHEPPVLRGSGHVGMPQGMSCVTCHSGLNAAIGGTFDRPAWNVAPVAHAWQGLTTEQICQSLKKHDLQDTLKYLAEAPVVKINWNAVWWGVPPGKHEDFVALTQAWVASGAHCPKGGPAFGAN
jgi:hypothetical protein